MTPNQITGLQAFARYMVNAALEDCNVDGGTIQEIAHQYGLLTKREMKGPCSEPEEGYCACAFVSGFPVECYQPTDALIAKSAPAEPDAELVELLEAGRLAIIREIDKWSNAARAGLPVNVRKESELVARIDAKLSSQEVKP